jgi:hypothetical protein
VNCIQGQKDFSVCLCVCLGVKWSEEKRVVEKKVEKVERVEKVEQEV